MTLNKGLISKELEIFLKTCFSPFCKTWLKFSYLHAIGFERLCEQNRGKIDNYLSDLKVFILYTKYNC